MTIEDAVTDVAEAPAKALESAIVESEHALKSINKPFREAEDYWYSLGPGLVTGASDDDPSGIATYSQAGAQFGFSLLWMAVFTFPLMTIVQEMCARIGMATGAGLASNIRQQYRLGILYALTGILFVTNVFNIGADLGAMAASAQLILPSFNFFTLLVVFTVVSMSLQIFVSYSNYARFLKYLTLVLFLYVITALTLDNVPWQEVWQNTIWPNVTWSKGMLIMICAILGTTISPYLFFWQTSQEVEARRQNGRLRPKLRHQVLTKKEVKKMRFDVVAGMFVSNLVMFFIIVTCAAVLFPQGIMVESAEQAAQALRPLAGDQAYLLFALGIIGTGLLAVPVLAGSAAYALAESFRWPGGLNKGLSHAHAFYGVIIIAMLLGMAMNFYGLNPMQALIYSAVLNGLVAPIILYFIVKISSNKEVMGQWGNGGFIRWTGYGVVTLMTLSAVGALWAML
jgi:NRAMP (natural resistance-associated macrophage protein)-like metal ion transporter